jgi:hypothetical protein
MIGTAYYNLEISDDKRLEEFLENLVIFTYPEAEYKESRTASVERMREGAPDDLAFITEAFTEEQPVYRKIVDKLIRNEDLPRDDVFHISNRINDVAFQLSEYKEQQYLSLLPTRRAIVEGALRVAYQWVLLLRHRCTEVQRCALEECRNIFIPWTAGHVKKYCSGACRIKAYRRRKTLTTSTS